MKDKKRISKIYNSKIFWAIISLILSLIIWSYVSNLDGSTITKDFNGIEVKFVGESTLRSQEGLVITDLETDTVSIKVRGSRSDISKLSASEIKAVVDVSGISQPSNVELSYVIEFPDNVNINDITIVSRNPEKISFTVEKNASKTIPVKGSFEGSIAEDCVAEEIVFDPETIVVEGPVNVLDIIDHAWVSFGENEEIDATFSMDTDFVLMDKDGNEISDENLIIKTDTIYVTQPIRKTVELPLSVRIINGGGVTELDCDISIEPSTISVFADSRLVDDKDSIVLGTIDLTDFKDSYEHTFTIPLEEGVENLTGTTEAVVKIQIPDVYVRTIKVSNISCVNCSPGYSAIINSETVEVTLRSRDEAALDAVKPEDVSIVVDLSDYGSTTGQVRPNGTVKIAGGGKIGAIGDVKVVLTIQKD